MVKYKIVGLGNVSMGSIRLERGEKQIIEDPGDNLMDNIERASNLGLVEVTKLEKTEMTTFKENSEDEEESEVEDDETEEDETYYCPECDREHRYDSQIGQEHLED